MRYWRTIRRLSPVQVAHRLRLRFRAALRRRFPRRARSLAVKRAGPVPPGRRRLDLPVELLRPCPDSATRERARAVAEGRYRFVGEERDLGREPFGAVADATLLWAYHLEYMDYLLDLALRGDRVEVERLARLRLRSGAGTAGRHPYPESRRATAWLETLPLVDGAAGDVLAEGAWRAAHRVAANLERDVGGNHLLENGLALILCGATFRGRRARRLLARGLQILYAASRDQVLADGAHYELSPMYHARVLAVLAEGFVAASSAGVRVPLEAWESVARMTAFLSGVLEPDGSIPLLGDSAGDPFVDPGRLARAVEAVLPVVRPASGTGDRGWTSAGIYRMEDPGEGHSLTLDAGQTCPDRLPAHGQADTFSITVYCDRRAMVVDAGLYEYRAGEMRDYCRATRAHSTVEVDGENSAEVWSSFRVGRGARVRDARWIVREGLGSFSAEHDGYRHLGVTHRRRVSHLAKGAWLIADRTFGRPHRAVSRLHLHPEVSVEACGDGGWRIARDGSLLHVRAFGRAFGGWEEGWHCPEFGRRERTRVLCLAGEGSSVASGFLLSVAPSARVRADGRLLRVRVGDREFMRGMP